MEFQETLLKFTNPEKTKKKPKPPHKWKNLSFHRSPSFPLSPKRVSSTASVVPKEFLCPITGAMMADPVIVSSGHTFERACVRACRNLNYTPALPDGAVPDFSTVIPNLAMKSTILNWYSRNKRGGEVTSLPLDVPKAERLIRERMEREELLCRLDDRPSAGIHHAVTEPARRPPASNSGESVESPLQLATRPSCVSTAGDVAEEPVQEGERELLAKLESLQAYDVERALASLRNITRTCVEERARLCTARVLSVLKTLAASRYVNVQVNAVACLVNLSLEKANKVKIVRCGVVPYLIDVLKCGFSEAQDHASGALFSLALDDYNKTAIGVLGALPPLLHLLRSSESEMARNDSALALYHLSFVRSNRSKLIKLGSIPVLLGMVGPDRVAGRVVLLLGNLAASEDGRAAILDSGGVARLVGVLERGELDNESTREGCVSVLCGLSHGGLRFRGLAKAVGAAEVLARVGNQGSERCSAMVRRILEVIKGRTGEPNEDEPVDWEDLLYSGSFSRTRSRPVGGKTESKVKSSEF